MNNESNVLHDLLEDGRIIKVVPAPAFLRRNGNDWLTATLESRMIDQIQAYPHKYRSYITSHVPDQWW